MHGSLILVVTLAFTGPDAVVAQNTRARGIPVENCYVKPIDDIDVPAQEPGVLISLEVTEGMEVEKGTMIGGVNDSKSQSTKKVAEAEAEVAKLQAENDINVRYAKSAAKVAKAEYKLADQANKKAPGSKPLTEIERLLLQAQRSDLQIEQADLELQVAELEHRAKVAQVAVAQDEIERRKIITPVSGQIVEVLKRRGEWVNPGDAVVRIVSLETLRVEGFLNFAEYPPTDMLHRSAIVKANVSGNQVEEFQGKITFVSPEIDNKGDYKFFVEVENREDGGSWLLLPGLETTVIIQEAETANRTDRDKG